MAAEVFLCPHASQPLSQEFPLMLMVRSNEGAQGCVRTEKMLDSVGALTWYAFMIVVYTHDFEIFANTISIAQQMHKTVVESEAFLH